ncbi:hypothetical protein SFRURICE_013012 [Spodoptera frugiperda]|nr:hypothetical protein SFRURICE_013012 [Spodoptera frugiperda]
MCRHKSNEGVSSSIFSIRSYTLERGPSYTNRQTVGQMNFTVLKSYFTTSYALDNTLHAICYHHVDNQRGSLVKQSVYS